MAEAAKLVGILFGCIFMYIATGTCASVLIDGDPFDWKKFICGIIKALVACVALILLSYVFSVVDLSSLGFEPKTAISAGIVTYAAKILQNVARLIKIGNASDASIEKMFDKVVAKAEDEYMGELVSECDEVDENGPVG